MIIDYEGSHPFDFDDITVQQGIAIEAHTGLPFAEWGAAIQKGGNLKALQALGWMIICNGDLAVPIADCDFKMGRLGAALTKAIDAERKAAEAAEPGPTVPGVPGGVTPAESNGTAPGGPLLPASSAPT